MILVSVSECAIRKMLWLDQKVTLDKKNAFQTKLVFKWTFINKQQSVLEHYLSLFPWHRKNIFVDSFLVNSDEK